jgi:hypothetical protein
MRQREGRRSCRRSLGAALAAALLLAGCSNDLLPSGGPPRAADDEINTYPANYRPEILGAMHAYLNDPTGIRDAGIADPALKSVGGNTRYVVCVRFNGKKAGNAYAGVKEIAAVFLVGRFDRFVDQAKEQCAETTYKPFPELQKLAR